jgi:hypothetical protein
MFVAANAGLEDVLSLAEISMICVTQSRVTQGCMRKNLFEFSSESGTEKLRQARQIRQAIGHSSHQ